MDWFSMVLAGGSLAGIGVLHPRFVCRFAGRRFRLGYVLLYGFLLGALEFLCTLWDAGSVLAVALQLLALYAVSRLAIGLPRAAAGTAALLAVYVSQLSFGVVNSLEAAFFSPDIRGGALYVLLLLATAAAFGICAGCYRLAVRCLPWEEEGQRPYLGLVLFPEVFALSAELYILGTAYNALPSSVSPAVTGRHLVLLGLQVLGLGALLCTLYAYRRLCRDFQARAELASLTQAARAQQTYVEQARLRYEKTRNFRHDLQNHLAVLNGLLASGGTEEARQYLDRLSEVSAGLSFPCRTGSPVVDVLLGEKLETARELGIKTELSLLPPERWTVDEFDLCVLFANALDNAIAACRGLEDSRRLRIRGERQGEFFLLAFENTCLPGPLPPMGTGLHNIRAAAEKYGGTILTEKDTGWFRLNILLVISQQ